MARNFVLPLTFYAFLLMLSFAAASERGSPMVLIPAGEFIMGSEAENGREDERPAHRVRLDAYYIDRYEATGKDFEAYMEDQPKVHPTITGWYDRKVRPDMANRPVFGLTWKRCRDYCMWLVSGFPPKPNGNGPQKARKAGTIPGAMNLPIPQGPTTGDAVSS